MRARHPVTRTGSLLQGFHAPPASPRVRSSRRWRRQRQAAVTAAPSPQSFDAPLRAAGGYALCVTILGIPRAMPDAQDQHAISLDAIAHHIGPHDRHLAPPFAGIAPAIGEFGQSVSQRDQPFAQANRRRGIECGNISDDRFEMADRLVRPDDPPHRSVADARPRQRLGASP